MAAQRGDWQRIERLLSRRGDAAAAPQAHDDVVVHIEEAVAGAVHVEMSYAMTPGEAVTMAGDSVLHVVASRGDGEEFLRARRRSIASPATSSSPPTKKAILHSAARAGLGRMVTHLIALASAVSDHVDGEKAKEFLRMQNEQGETALHEAVRLGSRDLVDRLMAVDPELARVPPADGASPLYLAVSLGHFSIAWQLHEKDNALSYSGPDGRSALHAAVLKSEGMTKMLLEWNRDLIKQAERPTGSTALHFASSWGLHEAISLLLAADPSLAYQPDSNGSFPIHVAAFTKQVKAVSVLLDGRHDCSELRDANGRTFLHVAVVEESQPVVRYACRSKHQNFGSLFMNMQDNDGNTALHLAVQVGNLWIFNLLMENRLVKLDLTNNKGQTPRDLSSTLMPLGIQYALNGRVMIDELLRDAGAVHGIYKLLHQRGLNEKEAAQKITEATQTVGISSVLITTVAFAVAFTLPGGYRADDHENGGSPTLAGHYAFDVFIVADILAFVLSSLSITSLIYARIVVIDIASRMLSVAYAAIFMASAERSLCAAFAVGIYVVLPPVARTMAIASCAITALVLLDTVWFMVTVFTSELMLVKRLGGVRAWWRPAQAILMIFWSQFWPYIAIAVAVLMSDLMGFQ
ncbi:hypothetical protein BRADI_3g07405v3 [Brachypodium distachyon]|uniref:PGG domain-containing protein n=1 Tax=Brachypodium distachyon TaxID=15368 RepID=A0A0Q3I0G6_BRADI|nr:hypothetical protein BRADI_3g07405v3 [Brachypodium distachyon]